MAEKDEKINEVAENIASAIVGDQESVKPQAEELKEEINEVKDEEVKNAPEEEVNEVKDEELKDSPEEVNEESDAEETDAEETDAEETDAEETDAEEDNEESDEEESDAEEESDDEEAPEETLDEDDIKEEDKDRVLRLLKEVNYFNGCYVGRLFKEQEITDEILEQAAEELMNFPQDLSDEHRECRLLLERIYIK